MALVLVVVLGYAGLAGIENTPNAFADGEVHLRFGFGKAERPAVASVGPGSSRLSADCRALGHQRSHRTGSKAAAADHRSASDTYKPLARAEDEASGGVRLQRSGDGIVCTGAVALDSELNCCMG